MKTVRLVGMMLVLLPGISLAQYERPGSAAAQFMKIGVSARATAMGDAFVAAARGAEATYYNPAALGNLAGTSITFNHTRLYAGISHDFVAVASSFGRWGTFGLSVTALQTGEMNVTTPLRPDGTGETFMAGNYRAGLSYARMLTDRVSMGGTVNYVNMSLFRDFSADAISVDIAALYNAGFRGFRFGMMISNFGSNIEFINESYPLPTNFGFGGVINAVENTDMVLTLSGTAVKPNDGRPLLQIGSEWAYRDLLFVRGGYRPNHDTASFSFGGGIGVGIDRFDLNFDYAYSDYDLLGAVHRITVGVAF